MADSRLKHLLDIAKEVFDASEDRLREVTKLGTRGDDLSLEELLFIRQKFLLSIFDAVMASLWLPEHTRSDLSKIRAEADSFCETVLAQVLIPRWTNDPAYTTRH